MDVSIVTIYNVSNYGTALQAYATQFLIEQTGNHAEVVNYITEQRRLSRILFWVPESIQKNPAKAWLYRIARLPNNLNKLIVFKRFWKQRLHLGKRKYYSITDLRKNPPSADTYLTGSDQVWNSDYNEGIDYGFFLDFGPEETRRVAYAASIGMERIPENEEDEFVRLLSKYDAISVRENRAVEELERIGIQAKLVLDPTLMLDRNQWLQLAADRVKDRDFILVMALYGEDGAIPDLARYVSKETGLEILELLWNPLKKRDWKTVYGKSPEEFLEYLNKAKFVITNSFHVTAFCVNLQKQFVSVKREMYNSRISSLLENLGIQNRYLDQNDDWSIYKEKIDYPAVSKKLDEMRFMSMQVLNEMLGTTDG